MQMDVEHNLANAREFIQVRKYSQARRILEEMPENPTARRWLAKLDEVELFGASSGAARKPKPVADASLMQDTILLFTQNDWDIKLQMNEMAQIEKKRGPNSIAAFLVILFFSLLGMGIVMLGIASAKREVVTLKTNADGTVTILWRKQNIRISSADQALATANAVKSGISYGGALAAGLIAFICYFVLFSL